MRKLSLIIMRNIFNLLCLLACLIVDSSVYGQTASLHGTVTDEAGSALAGATVSVKGTSTGILTDAQGTFRLELAPGEYYLSISYLGYETFESSKIKLASGETKKMNFLLKATNTTLEEIVVSGYDLEKEDSESSDQASKRQERQLSGKAAGVVVKPASNLGIKIRPKRKKTPNKSYSYQPAQTISSQYDDQTGRPDFSREGYDHITENSFKEVSNDPLSTFSIDVDRASYANVRRFLSSHQLPPKDAVRIEELINYFDYDYPQPKGEHPFAIQTDIAKCPWQPENYLVQIGLKGRELDFAKAPANNLVFLLDVSGSMSSPGKLPLLKQAFKLLVENLRSQDRVAIVVYAGAAGLVLPSTPGSQKEKILSAIDRLNAGGSTAGGAGIQLAYKTALDNLLSEGNNRVILATDGDFNVGISSDGELVRLIEKKRNAGVFLTVLGFGSGNYQDAKMEKLAGKGNGNYAYIDNLLEAKKVLVNEISGTLFTIAKDVKIQIEFNPNQVKAYRLIGYENRLLNKEDFNDDTKDAGELGAGHTVTALYELIPADAIDPQLASVDPLKYQELQKTSAAMSAELMTIKFRYKTPLGDKSQLILHTLERAQIRDISKASDNLAFASAVAEWGMLIRDSAFKSKASYASLIKRAEAAKGKDPEGYRAEFIRLAKTTELLAK